MTSKVLPFKSEADFPKLSGLHIEEARIMKDGPVGYLELEVSHITLPNKVIVRIHPAVQTKVGIMGVVILSGFEVQTEDVPEKEANPDG